MILDLQFKIKNNPHYIRYLRERSYWYKYLNRDPRYFKNFEDEVKINYKLRPSDRISHAIDAIDMIQSLLSNLR